MTSATTSSCCSPAIAPPSYKPTLGEQLLDIALKVSVAALGILAAISSFQSFIATFAIGIALGVYQGWNQKPQAKVLASGNFCTQGFIEQATGVKLPSVAHLAINVGLTAEHLVGHHKSEIYSMLLGLYTGTWIGNEIAPALSLAFHKVRSLF